MRFIHWIVDLLNYLGELEMGRFEWEKRQRQKNLPHSCGPL